MDNLSFQALEQQAGASENFQETATDEKEATKRKFSMDASLEDKICDLYDLYVDVTVLCLQIPIGYSIAFLFEKTFVTVSCLLIFVVNGFRGWMKMRVLKSESFTQRYFPVCFIHIS